MVVMDTCGNWLSNVSKHELSKIGLRMFYLCYLDFGDKSTGWTRPLHAN